MKLLICTQIIDKNDPALGFFHEWVKAFAVHYEQITVICLKKGEYTLPNNVSVHSLGKEKGTSRFGYIKDFYTHVWRERGNYDAVFVHMNQEYVLLGAPLWRVLGKGVYMWRNHYAGSFATRIAGMLCNKVFYTSKASYTATFKNAVQMPVGVDLERFKPIEGIVRKPRSILFLGRISPSKKPDVLVEALGFLKGEGVEFTASFYGPTLPGDEPFTEKLKERVEALGIHGEVYFGGPLPHSETPRVYQEHEIYVNLADSGMYDKTLFEAAASGCTIIATSKDFEHLTGVSAVAATKEATAEQVLLHFSEKRVTSDPAIGAMVRSHGLVFLAQKVNTEMT